MPNESKDLESHLLSIKFNQGKKSKYWEMRKTLCKLKNISLLKCLLGEPLGKYHKIETLKRLNTYIYFGLSGHHQELHETD